MARTAASTQVTRTSDRLRCSADIRWYGTHHKNVSGTALTYMSCVWFQELGNFLNATVPTMMRWNHSDMEGG
jgi:hypothetical protein